MADTFNRSAHGQRRQERAVAIKYDQAADTPRVLASGVGEIARQIVRLAQAHDIPLHEDKELAELLSQIPNGAPVSDACIEAVAEILCFLYAADRHYANALAADPIQP